MPCSLLSISDLEPFGITDSDKAQAMINDASALAARVAPCLLDDDFLWGDAARAILRSVVLRWDQAGTGAVQSQSAGPYSVTLDTRSEWRSLFWPSDIAALQDLCRDNGVETGQAFQIDTVPTSAREGYWSRPDTWVPY